MSKLTEKDMHRIANAFISDLYFLQGRLESMADEEFKSDMLEHGAHGCINMFGISETLERRVDMYREAIKEVYSDDN